MKKPMFFRRSLVFLITLSLVSFCYAEEAAKNDKGIKEPASQGGGFQQIGQMVGAAGLGISIAGAMATCKPYTSPCKYWIAGAVASAGVMAAMMMAKKKSDSSKDASSVDGLGSKIKGITDTGDETTDDSVQNKQVKEDIKKLERLGYKIDLKKGEWYDPNEKKTFTSEMFSSPQAMAAAGMSDSDIADFNGVAKQIAKQVKDVAGKADANITGGQDNSIGGSGGGGSNGATAATENASSGGTPKIGLNRNPAQVNGMAKLYNGERIGVSGDSLFEMMNRRYKLHSERGSFIDNPIQK